MGTVRTEEDTVGKALMDNALYFPMWKTMIATNSVSSYTWSIVIFRDISIAEY